MEKVTNLAALPLLPSDSRPRQGDVDDDTEGGFLFGDPPPVVQTVGDLAKVVQRLADWADVIFWLALVSEETRPTPAALVSISREMHEALDEVATVLETGRRPKPLCGTDDSTDVKALEAAARQLIQHPDGINEEEAAIQAKFILDAIDSLRDHEAESTPPVPDLREQLAELVRVHGAEAVRAALPGEPS